MLFYWYGKSIKFIEIIKKAWILRLCIIEFRSKCYFLCGQSGLHFEWSHFEGSQFILSFIFFSIIILHESGMVESVIIELQCILQKILVHIFEVHFFVMTVSLTETEAFAGTEKQAWDNKNNSNTSRNASMHNSFLVFSNKSENDHYNTGHGQECSYDCQNVQYDKRCAHNFFVLG